MNKPRTRGQSTFVSALLASYPDLVGSFFLMADDGARTFVDQVVDDNSTYSLSRW